MSYLSKPEILRFHPLPPFIFPLQSWTVKWKYNLKTFCAVYLNFWHPCSLKAEQLSFSEKFLHLKVLQKVLFFVYGSIIKPFVTFFKTNVSNIYKIPFKYLNIFDSMYKCLIIVAYTYLLLNCLWYIFLQSTL